MKPLRLILVFALLQGIVAFFTMGGSFTHEESMWHYIGHNWFQLGLTPYAGGADNKSPLIFAVFGLSDFLFGLNFWFPRVLGIAVQSAGIYYLYKIALHICRSRGVEFAKDAGLFTITFYGLSLTWHASGGKYVSFTETYAISFLIISVYYYLTSTAGLRKEYKSLFLSGLMAGLAFGWRISAGFGIAAIILHALFKRRFKVIHFIAGFGTAIVALAALAVALGINLQGIYLYAFAENFGSGSTTDHSFQWKVKSFLASFFYSELLLFYPFVIGFFFLRRKLNLSSLTNGFLTLWLIFEFIGINIPGIYAFAHFKHLLPVLSLMSGIFIVQWIVDHKLRIQFMLIAIWLIFFPKSLEPLYALKAMFVKQPEISPCTPPYPLNETAEKKLGEWIKEHTAKEDRVLIAGFGARVQLYSERLSPSIYFNVTQTPRAIEQFKKELATSSPALIAIPLFPAYYEYVREDLRSFIIDLLISRDYKEVEPCLYGYTIYVNAAPTMHNP